MSIRGYERARALRDQAKKYRTQAERLQSECSKTALMRLAETFEEAAAQLEREFRQSIREQSAEKNNEVLISGSPAAGKTAPPRRRSGRRSLFTSPGNKKSPPRREAVGRLQVS